jgi:hypothetical protein
MSVGVSQTTVVCMCICSVRAGSEGPGAVTCRPDGSRPSDVKGGAGALSRWLARWQPECHWHCHWQSRWQAHGPLVLGGWRAGARRGRLAAGCAASVLPASSLLERKLGGARRAQRAKLGAFTQWQAHSVSGPPLPRRAASGPGWPFQPSGPFPVHAQPAAHCQRGSGRSRLSARRLPRRFHSPPGGRPVSGFKFAGTGPGPPTPHRTGRASSRFTGN